MKICILGDSLSSLSLALMFVNKNIYVDLYTDKTKKKILSTRTIGISSSNINFFNEKILKINSKKLWGINEIEVYTEKHDKKILDFKKKNKSLFSLIKNKELYFLLLKKLQKNKLFKKNYINNNIFYKNLLTKNKYDLIFNCDDHNMISKKFFFKKINKDYNDVAYTTIINHSNLSNNNSASQIFTKNGPIAFLPISKNQTSVVYSVNSKGNNLNEKKIIELIKKYNSKYLINNHEKINTFKLKSINLRKYYFQNIIAFGDLIHKIHPLAGQGFNMTLRDLQAIYKIIQNKIDLGLRIDNSVAIEFEKKMKHKNFIFSNGIDLIYEFFNFDRKIRSNNLSRIIKFIGNNKPINKLFISFADKGLI